MSKQFCTPAKPTPPAAAKAQPVAATAIWTSNCLRQAATARAPIQSSCLRRAGRPASSAPWGLTAGKLGVKLPADVAVDAEVDLAKDDTGFFLAARLNVSLPGLDKASAQALVDGAHQACPYSKLSRGNIDVEINLV